MCVYLNNIYIYDIYTIAKRYKAIAISPFRNFQNFHLFFLRYCPSTLGYPNPPTCKGVWQNHQYSLRHPQADTTRWTHFPRTSKSWSTSFRWGIPVPTIYISVFGFFFAIPFCTHWDWKAEGIRWKSCHKLPNNASTEEPFVTVKDWASVICKFDQNIISTHENTPSKIFKLPFLAESICFTLSTCTGFVVSQPQSTHE